MREITEQDIRDAERCLLADNSWKGCDIDTACEDCLFYAYEKQMGYYIIGCCCPGRERFMEAYNAIKEAYDNQKQGKNLETKDIKDREEIKMGEEYRTMEGRPTRIICVDREDEEYSVIALVIQKNGVERIGTYAKYGFCLPDEFPSIHDLIKVTLYEGWEAGDIIRVWDKDEDDKYLARFKCAEYGLVYTYDSESMNGSCVTPWKHAEFICKNPDKKEDK